MIQLSLIGGGNMAEALVRGVLAAGFLAPADLLVSEPDEARRLLLSSRYGVTTSFDNVEAVRAAPRVLLAVKPQQLAEAVGGWPKRLVEGKLVLSILAGVSTSRLGELLGSHSRVVRVMPNTPALAQAGASALYFAEGVSAEDRAWSLRLFESVGEAIGIEKESLMDAVTGLSGSGPAFVYKVIEAMSDGGVAAGLPRSIALHLAAQTVMGAAKMVLETRESPATLKEKVTSPGGTTMAGLRVLEAQGVHSAFIEAVVAAARRSEELGRASG